MSRYENNQLTLIEACTYELNFYSILLTIIIGK